MKCLMNDDKRQTSTIECSHISRVRESSHCLQRLIENLFPLYWPDLQKHLQDLFGDKNQLLRLESNNTLLICYALKKTLVTHHAENKEKNNYEKKEEQEGRK